MSDDKEVLLPSAPLAPQDEALQALFQELETRSLETLEAAARQIITLSTTLLGLFFGILALKDAPDYLGLTWIKMLAALSLLAFLAALFCALNVLLPRLTTYNRRDLSAMRHTFDLLLQRKSRSLQWAQWLFGAGALFLLALILFILLGI